MEIDPRIEARVRDAYRWIFDKNMSNMQLSLAGLSNADREKVFAYAVFVLCYTVRNTVRGSATDNELRLLADEIITSEAWAGPFGEDSMVALLRAALAGNTEFPDVPRDDLVGNVFIAGAYLLGVYRAEGQQWWEYLDEIWDAARYVDDGTVRRPRQDP